MELTTIGHRQNSTMKDKKYTMWKQFWSIEGEDGDTNITSNGKDIWSPKFHGNWRNPFQTTVTFSISTNNATNYEFIDSRNCFHIIADG